MSVESSEREREGILHGLTSPDEEVRRLAVERASCLGVDDALPLLVDALGDPSWRVRKAAVARLVVSEAPGRIELALIAALYDGENPGRRNSAFEALVSMGPRVVPAMIEALSTEDVDVRKLIVDALAGIGDVIATPTLIGSLRDEDPNVRAASADALGVVGGPGAGEAMTRCALDEDEDTLVRLSALMGLARIEHAVEISKLDGALHDSLLRPAVYVLLGEVGGHDAVDCLLGGVASQARSSREAAIGGLLKLLERFSADAAEGLEARVLERARAIDGLPDACIERLPDADLATRIVLIQFLGLLREPRSVVPILEAGRDEAIVEIAHSTLAHWGEGALAALESAWPKLDSDLRVSACDLIGQVGGERAPHILRSALDEADSTLRAAAARAAGEGRCADLMPLLVERLEGAAIDPITESDEESTAIVGALVELARWDAQADRGLAGELVALLAGRLETAESEARVAVATVLGKVGRTEDEELIVHLLKDPDPAVRRSAVVALARLEPGAASEPLRLALADESARVRLAAATALGEAESPRVIEDLHRLILDEDSRVRSAAVRGIGIHAAHDHVSVEEAVSLIDHAIGGDSMMALAAVEALDAMGGARAAEAALRLLDRSEPELVQAAVACIGRHGEAETVAELLPLVGHGSWSVRSEAIQAMADRHVVQAIPAILRRLETEQDSFVRDTILRALKSLED
jgi:HEAT repeat protein